MFTNANSDETANAVTMIVANATSDEFIAVAINVKFLIYLL